MYHIDTSFCLATSIINVQVPSKVFGGVRADHRIPDEELILEEIKTQETHWVSLQMG